MTADDAPFQRAEPADEPPRRSPPAFRTTLIRVLLVQAVALVLLWVLQARYHLG